MYLCSRKRKTSPLCSTLMSAKIYKKEKIGPAMWVMRCPHCGAICASASEREILPEFTTCLNEENHHGGKLL